MVVVEGTWKASGLRRAGRGTEGEKSKALKAGRKWKNIFGWKGLEGQQKNMTCRRNEKSLFSMTPLCPVGHRWQRSHLRGRHHAPGSEAGAGGEGACGLPARGPPWNSASGWTPGWVQSSVVREPGLTAAQGRPLPQRRQTFTLACGASPALLPIPEEKLGCVF